VRAGGLRIASLRGREHLGGCPLNPGSCGSRKRPLPALASPASRSRLSSSRVSVGNLQVEKAGEGHFCEFLMVLLLSLVLFPAEPVCMWFSENLALYFRTRAFQFDFLGLLGEAS